MSRHAGVLPRIGAGTARTCPAGGPMERTKCSFSILQMGHRVRISGNFKFNIDLAQLLQIISAFLSIIAAIVTIIMLW
jgi:hypothetical protein